MGSPSSVTSSTALQDWPAPGRRSPGRPGSGPARPAATCSSSPPQQELLRVHQPPHHVLQRRPPVLRLPTNPVSSVHFVRRRRAAQGRQVQLLDDLPVRLARRQQLAEAVVRVAPASRCSTSPVSSWNAWPSVVSSERSHSQVSEPLRLAERLQEPLGLGGLARRAAPAWHARQLRRPACRPGSRRTSAGDSGHLAPPRRAAAPPAAAGPAPCEKLRLVVRVRLVRARPRAGTSASS